MIEFFSVTKYKFQPRIDKLTFEQLIAYLKPQIDILSNLNRDRIPGFDVDDIKQELIIELWEKLHQIPDDMRLDFRFTRYTQTIFNRKIIDLERAQFIQKDGIRLKGEYRDCYFRSYFVGENVEVFDNVKPSL